MSTLPNTTLATLADVSVEELAEVVSRASWEERLTADDRARLGGLLPFGDDEAERAVALDTVFSCAPVRFGSAVGRAWELLRAGALTAAAAAEREESRRAHDEAVAAHHDDLVRRLHTLRRTWLPPQPKPPRATKRKKADDWLVYSKEGGGLVRRNLKQPPAARGSKQVAEAAAARGSSLASDSEGEPAPPAGRKRAAPDTSPAEASSASGLAAASGLALPDGFSPQLQFARLVRDAISSVPQEFAPAEYVRKQVQVQAEAGGQVALLPKGTALQQYIRSILLFMSTSADELAAASPADEHAARTQAGDSAAPPDAAVDFDELTQSYRWRGPTGEHADAELRRLEVLHFERFVSQHGGVVSGSGGARGLHAPIRSQKAALTLPPGSAEQLAFFQREEAMRYSSPNQAWVYTLRDGSQSSVSPIGKKSSAVGKAREHFLLRPERPPSVTLLALVRDAAARLPGGEGSRADVCELLKESQYLIGGVNDAQISQVASGALDRLHQEQDPCVTYESERKVWIYLHADRQASDFHALPLSKKSKVASLL
ncbi:hypothetical protein EMIHUDRAFT_468885 [Emiliania huxleyi CCMP1516]|uniref:Nuclear factor related to kappa-B-binding protein second winged helix domain-containing protein n=2 Tax=Emiliania huxleyi TaxID=2903 RepID=A0A0D3JV39_EMIH1|nr:hypothetical protein EMIHUDRAFT_468885 [Emiliania huxleyi CCMP1516]EOD27374.1 hypothetical protein EMIHUDRAFT_468885 [Emiliania huxleyi CCMP1516]|eukprot:XP_005779803.1 hypothetical protein EMIHUDRAFT_468885 [Emiliania huxleyi CCMP1516]